MRAGGAPSLPPDKDLHEWHQKSLPHTEENDPWHEWSGSHQWKGGMDAKCCNGQSQFRMNVRSWLEPNRKKKNYERRPLPTSSELTSSCLILSCLVVEKKEGFWLVCFLLC